jgi:hypothetical protein
MPLVSHRTAVYAGGKQLYGKMNELDTSVFGVAKEQRFLMHCIRYLKKTKR